MSAPRPPISALVLRGMFNSPAFSFAIVAFFSVGVGFGRLARAAVCLIFSFLRFPLASCLSLSLRFRVAFFSAACGSCFWRRSCLRMVSRAWHTSTALLNGLF